MLKSCVELTLGDDRDGEGVFYISGVYLDS